jgi:hypothetical protein
MNQGPVRTVHFHLTVKFDWKMTAVIACAYLIRLLFMK